MPVGFVVPLITVTVDVIPFIPCARSRPEVQGEVVELDRRRIFSAVCCRRRRLLLAPIPAARLAAFSSSGHRSVHGGEVAHHRLILLLLVRVHRLRVLAKIVQARELLSTMTRERPFARMFSKSGIRHYPR